MKIKITYANNIKPRFEEINTLDELINITKEENEDVIILKSKPIDADLKVIVYNDYIE